MELSLTGKHALVCGSSQGIGKAAAIEIAKLGATVTLVARDAGKLKEVLAILDTSQQQKHQYLTADFDHPESLKTIINEHIRQNGTIHILVNNTGGPPAGKIETALEQEFIKTFNNHLLCNHLLMQAVVEGMKKAGYGRIINVISTSVKQPLKGLGVSNTIRAAVANWSKTLAGELAPFKITVNNVLPGATYTQRLKSILDNKSKSGAVSLQTVTEEMTAEIPMGRFAEPEEIANAIAFLASPAASYITGINVPVDGGRTLCL